MRNIICQLEPDEGLTTLSASLCAADFQIFFHKKLTTVLRQLHNHPRITKAASRLFLSVTLTLLALWFIVLWTHAHAIMGYNVLRIVFGDLSVFDCISLS